MEVVEEGVQLLIVDDTPENVDVLAAILREHYQIKVALNGAKALQIAESDRAKDLQAAAVVDAAFTEEDPAAVKEELTDRLERSRMTAWSRIVVEARISLCISDGAPIFQSTGQNVPVHDWHAEDVTNRGLAHQGAWLHGWSARASPRSKCSTTRCSR